MSPGITSVLSTPRVDADSSGHLDGAGLSGIVGVGDDFEFEIAGEFGGVRIAGDDRDGRTILPVMKRREDIEQHGLSERGARRLVENRGETLFRGRRILDRNEDHGSRSRRRNVVPCVAGSSSGEQMSARRRREFRARARPCLRRCA